MNKVEDILTGYTAMFSDGPTLAEEKNIRIELNKNITEIENIVNKHAFSKFTFISADENFVFNFQIRKRVKNRLKTQI